MINCSEGFGSEKGGTIYTKVELTSLLPILDIRNVIIEMVDKVKFYWPTDKTGLKKCIRSALTSTHTIVQLTLSKEFNISMHLSIPRAMQFKNHGVVYAKVGLGTFLIGNGI